MGPATVCVCIVVPILHWKFCVLGCTQDYCMLGQGAPTELPSPSSTSFMRKDIVFLT